MDWTNFKYDSDGNFEGINPASDAGASADSITGYVERMKQLSGTLQLPLKTTLGGELAHVSYEIYGEASAAYVLYYIFDDVVAASLIMPGADPEAEFSVQNVFRYLLLEEGDETEPTEEYIDKLLESEQFDFEAHYDNHFEPDDEGAENAAMAPASFTVWFVPPSGQEDSVAVVNKIDSDVTAAFMSRVATG